MSSGMVEKTKAGWGHIKRTYGLTKEQFHELADDHCPICLREWSDTVQPCVDHDHKTRKVRGIVCRFCNHYRIGRLREPDIVYRIADYLRDALEFDFVMPPEKKKRRKRRGTRTKS